MTQEEFPIYTILPVGSFSTNFNITQLKYEIKYDLLLIAQKYKKPKIWTFKVFMIKKTSKPRFFKYIFSALCITLHTVRC